jgi:hypothetical protein
VGQSNFQGWSFIPLWSNAFHGASPTTSICADFLLGGTCDKVLAVIDS